MHPATTGAQGGVSRVAAMLRAVGELLAALLRSILHPGGTDTNDAFSFTVAKILARGGSDRSTLQQRSFQRLTSAAAAVQLACNSGCTIALATSLLIAKSPRSGSTLLHKLISSHPNASIGFEPTLVDTPSWLACSKRSAPLPTLRACGASVNDLLRHPARAQLLFASIECCKAKLILQLRWNVVEKSASAQRLFDTAFRKRARKKCPVKMSKANRTACIDRLPLNPSQLRRQSINAWSSLEAHVAAAHRLFPDTSIFVWYEDLVRRPQAEYERILSFAGLPPHRPKETRLLKRGRFRPLSAVANLNELKKAFASHTALLAMMEEGWSERVESVVMMKRLHVANRTITYGHW